MSYRYKIATVFLLGFFIDCINIFMSAIALPEIAIQFSVPQSMMGWVSNAYILGLVMIMPLSLYFASILGHRRLLCYSMLLFALCAWLIGISESIYALIFFRLLQGAAGGLLIPVGQALVFALFPNQQRQKISTLIMLIALCAPAFSPALGGVIVDRLGWQWVFFTHIPLALLAALLAWLWVRESHAQQDIVIDMRGLFIFNGSLFALLLAFSLYSDYHLVGFALISLTIAVLMMVLYIKRSQRHRATAVLNLALLKNYNFRNAFIVYYAVPGIFTGVNLLNIFNLQLNLGLNGYQTGLFMCIYALGALISMIVGAYLYHRFAQQYLFGCGIVLHSLGIFLLSFVSTIDDLPILIFAYLLMGSGGGLSANTAQISALIDFKGQDLMQGSVLWNINRQVAFSVGTVIVIFIYGLFATLAPLQRYHLTFLIVAILGTFALISVFQEKNHD